ncbi:GGDEF domain-containing protein [Alteromonas sp. KUL49]|uniref:tetratricopeptide repeat-containing diguanylate cyclase n=1 Tax=Alteromonas sp. KUL49 TaxID=2480798 RepID=UPI00102EFA21|nr:GGDEF domain-containing protein [Alteromonas sp. KUL49]TAP33577.1 GGDEF domain-containing protein [Alteromonas sp. KUL49]GEA13706.1 hypothetical protein KUL49_40810 [Alteromonas sp. KUL49]
MRHIFIAIVYCFFFGFSGSAHPEQIQSQHDKIIALVDRVAVESPTDYHILVENAEASYTQLQSLSDKLEAARALLLWHFMIDDEEGTAKYASELQQLALALNNQPHFDIARLYQGFTQNPDLEDAVAFVQQWSDSLSASNKQNLRVRVHRDLVITYTKLRPMIFPFELQYLIQHLETISDDPEFAQEKHVILWSLVARGWSIEQSLTYYEEFIAGAEANTFPVHKYLVLYNIAILMASSEYVDAAIYLGESYVELALAQAQLEELFYGYERLGEALSHDKQYQAANIALEQAHQYDMYADELWLAQINLIQAENYFFLGEVDKGRKLLTAAEEALKAQDESYRITTNYVNRVLGKLALLEGRTEDALEHYETYIINNRNDVHQRRIEDIQGVRSSMERLIVQAESSQALAEKRLTQFQYASYVLVAVSLIIVLMAIRQTKISSQLKSKTVELQKINRQDSLTKLFNRGYWELQVHLQISQRKRYHKHIASLALFDIDNFKSINDEYGHVAGDAVIKLVAETVQKEIREVDVAGRYGGEEFGILFPQTSIQAALQVTERIRKALEKAVVEFDNKQITFTASFGLAPLANYHSTAKIWVNEADTALYQSKEQGKNQCTIFSNTTR